MGSSIGVAGSAFTLRDPRRDVGAAGDADEAETFIVEARRDGRGMVLVARVGWMK
jgi:hypothetical protein